MFSISDTTTIRISREIYNVVKTLAQERNENMQDVLEHAITEYKKKKFFEELNEAYFKLKSDEKMWEDELEEREQWDRTLVDGIENDNEDK